MKKRVLVAVLAAFCWPHLGQGQTSLDQGTLDEDWTHHQFDLDIFNHGSPTPTPLPIRLMRVNGEIFQKIGDHLYLAVMQGWGGYGDKKTWAADQIILLRGEPQERIENSFLALAVPDGSYTYETITGLKSTVDAYRVIAVKISPKPSTADVVFGAGSGFGHTALDGKAENSAAEVFGTNSGFGHTALDPH
ncbi:MAG: hypothetical protein ABSE62_00640 [Chthoniobacteraceae bacterium]|jgi:hypothetical protein